MRFSLSFLLLWFRYVWCCCHQAAIKLHELSALVVAAAAAVAFLCPVGTFPWIRYYALVTRSFLFESLLLLIPQLYFAKNNIKPNTHFLHSNLKLKPPSKSQKGKLLFMKKSNNENCISSGYTRRNQSNRK